MKERLYDTDEIAAICDRKVETVREWIRNGVLPATKRGRSYYVTESDLKTFLEARHG